MILFQTHIFGHFYNQFKIYNKSHADINENGFTKESLNGDWTRDNSNGLEAGFLVRQALSNEE